MQVPSKGQVTIPLDIRNRLGLQPNTEVEFELAGDHARIRKARRAPGGSARGRLAVELLRNAGDVPMSTDELMALTRGEPPLSQAPQVNPALPGLPARLRSRRGVLVDNNVLVDIITADVTWPDWCARALAEAAEYAPLVINPIVSLYRREPLPWEVGFPAGKCFLRCRRLGGARTSPLPDFYIGEPAAVGKLALLTRDAARYRTWFPTIELLTYPRSSVPPRPFVKI